MLPLDDEVEALARSLGDLTGESVADAVRTAVRERLEREERRRRVQGSMERVKAITRARAANSVIDPRAPEEMLCDERGLPK